MKSPSHLSSLIRAKKRKMKEDPDVIDSGGSPREDLQDLDIERQNESSMAMDHNDPKEHDEGQDLSNASESREEESAQKISNGSMEGREEADRELLRNARKDRLRKKMK